MLQSALKRNTQMSRAFLKALGYTPPKVNSRKSKQRARYVNRMRYKGMEQCRKQTHGVIWRDD